MAKLPDQSVPFPEINQEISASVSDGGYGSSGGASSIGGAGGRNAFRMVWNVIGKEYEIADPIVVVNGGRVAVGSPGSLDNGSQVVCYVWTVEGSAAAQMYDVAHERPDLPNGAKVLAIVPIADLNDTDVPNGVVQHHVGAIVVSSGGSILGEQGASTGSTADKIPGGEDIGASCASGSGLVMATYRSGNAYTLGVDLRGRTEDKSFGIHEVTRSDSTESPIYVLSTGDIVIPKGGDVTGTVLQDYDLDYSTSNHELTYTKTTIDLATGDPGSKSGTVFTAVPHYTSSSAPSLAGVSFE